MTQKFYIFIDKKITPLVDDEHYYDSIYTPDLGYFDDDGVFQPNGEKEGQSLWRKYRQKALDVEKEFRAFGMRELNPILMEE